VRSSFPLLRVHPYLRDLFFQIASIAPTLSKTPSPVPPLSLSSKTLSLKIMEATQRCGRVIGFCGQTCVFFFLLSSLSKVLTVVERNGQNGDALSKIYVGTGAINTSFTRTGKKSLAGMLSDATKRCASFSPVLFYVAYRWILTLSSLAAFLESTSRISSTPASNARSTLFSFVLLSPPPPRIPILTDHVFAGQPLHLPQSPHLQPHSRPAPCPTSLEKRRVHDI
jgi:hypothetical protein